ncbi:hypothetical protein FS837_006793 [Tulasnella sp. UAMH 9824]|nr:hypothetical protein FS837_006793 [Tulasnella sp. UAMH 9824]
MALKLSQQRPLHIQGYPDPSRTVAANLEDLRHFLIHVEPHRDRWASFSLLFPSSVMKKVKKCLASPAPGLQSLSLCMANVGLATDDAFTMEAAEPMEETDRSLNILGGEAGNLQRLSLNNIPCLWDPSPFTEIAELSLTNGIEIRFTDLITFFRRCSNLHTLRLVNTKFADGAAHVVEETVSLPGLTELVLVELIERTGLGLLWLSLDAPACSKLQVNLRPSEEIAEHPALPSRAAPTVQKALGSNDKSFLRFQCNIDTNTQSAIWRSQDVDRPGQGEPRASFDIAFRGLGNGLAGFVCDFVRGVRERVGDVGGIVVNVAESFSGAFDQPLGVELEDLVPSLFPRSFRGLNVVEIRADVVHDHLRLLLEMMVPPEPQVWWLDALRTIRLSAIPKDELDVIPHETIQYPLKDFIRHISKHHYGIVLGLDEPKPPGNRSLSVVLQGVFDMSTRMNRALKDGKKVWGVTMKRADVFLADGEVQEKATEEEVQEADEEADVYASK